MLARDRGTLAAAVLSLALMACAGPPAPSSAPDGRVVDTKQPAFSDPTAITNPLFPAATVTQLVHLGVDGGRPLRVEVTLMPETRTVEWNGQSIETVVVQFAAYRERRILEVAYDYFAQADDGSVWYFGELVDNYRDGTIANHSGAWLAGEDGPPGMIMPAHPEVGDIFHPENIPGVVFEELIVLETDVSTPGPSGEINGAIRVEEHLMEGNVEQKIFAPGYGEFLADAPTELVTVAIGVPTDARAGDEPEALATTRTSIVAIGESAAVGDWEAAAADLAEAHSGWETAQGSDPPRLVAQEMDTALEAVWVALGSRDEAGVRRASIDALQAVLDLQLQYRTPGSVDLGRVGLWSRQMLLDADLGDAAFVRSDIAILSTIWNRAKSSAEPAAASIVDELLTVARAAAQASDLAAARDAAADLIVATTVSE